METNNNNSNISNSKTIKKKKNYIVDPRRDTAAVSMRSKRALSVYKKLMIFFNENKNNNDDDNNISNIPENKLNLKQNDIFFYEEFIKCSESIKQELLYLWEEVGHLNEELYKIEENKKNLNK